MDAEELNRLAAAAMQRVTEWVHRSAGQHLRALREHAQRIRSAA